MLFFARQEFVDPVAVRLAAGESREIDLGSARNVTGLRISDGGKGTYEIQVR